MVERWWELKVKQNVLSIAKKRPFSSWSRAMLPKLFAISQHVETRNEEQYVAVLSIAYGVYHSV